MGPLVIPLIGLLNLILYPVAHFLGRSGGFRFSFFLFPFPDFCWQL